MLLLVQCRCGYEYMHRTNGSFHLPRKVNMNILVLVHRLLDMPARTLALPLHPSTPPLSLPRQSLVPVTTYVEVEV